jgi:hypothetical protein
VKLRSFFLTWLLLGSLLPEVNSLAQEAKPRYVLLDARSTSDADMADIFTAIAASRKQTDWRAIIPSHQDDLSSILAREYNLRGEYLQLYPKTNEALRAMIKIANSPLDLEAVPLPALLSLPPVPAIPNQKTARADLVQVLGRDARYFVVRLASLLSNSNALTHEQAQTADAGMFALEDSSAFQDQFSKQSHTHARHLFRGAVQDWPVQLLSAQTGCTASQIQPTKNEIPDDVMRRVSQIPESAAGDLFVFDFDLTGNDCSHGKSARCCDATPQPVRCGTSHQPRQS